MTLASISSRYDKNAVLVCVRVIVFVVGALFLATRFTRKYIRGAFYKHIGKENSPLLNRLNLGLFGLLLLVIIFIPIR
jgi:hypothetical protein